MDYAKLKGTKTEANLMAAFAGESQARNKYTYYASKARKDGYQQIADIFEETAANEKEHAKLWFKYLHNGEVPGTMENLEDAAAGDDHLAEGAADDRIHDDACGAGLFGRQRDLAGMAVSGFGFVSVGLVLFRCFVLVEVGLHGGIVLFVGMIMRTRAVAGDQRQGAEQGHKGSRFHGFLSVVFLFPGQR